MVEIAQHADLRKSLYSDERLRNKEKRLLLPPIFEEGIEDFDQKQYHSWRNTYKSTSYYSRRVINLNKQKMRSLVVLLESLFARSSF